MFFNSKVEKRYKEEFNSKIELNKKFDIQAFNNVINLGLKSIKQYILDNDFSFDLNDIIEFYFYDENLWKSIEKEIEKYRKASNLVINNKKESLEYLLEETYKYNLNLLKIKTFDATAQLKNFFFYFVAGIFALKLEKKNNTKIIVNWLEKAHLIESLQELDHYLLIYEKCPEEHLILLITLLNWLNDSIYSLLQVDVGLKLRSINLLNQNVNHQNNKQQSINQQEEKLEQQAKIIPLKLTADKLKKLNDHFKNRIIGQDQVVDKINEILISQMYNISKKSHRPIGVLFFVGPTGVGKTETVKELAQFLYGNDHIHRFDMSEYKSEVAIQKLIGAPNGYVGYQEGGTLTNAMIRNPNTIVLFDEIEKADKCVFDLFLQMIDEGFVTSNKGVKCYFDNTIIVFTSNLGVSNINPKMGFDNIQEIIKENVEYFFNNTINRPELLGRIGNDNIVVFNFIDKQEDLFKILDIHFNNFISEYKELEITLDYNREDVYKAILSNADLSKGARDIRNKFELFKKHLYHAFFIKDLSIDDMKNKIIKFEYDGKVAKIIEINKKS